MIPLRGPPQATATAGGGVRAEGKNEMKVNRNDPRALGGVKDAQALRGAGASEAAGEARGAEAKAPARKAAAGGVNLSERVGEVERVRDMALQQPEIRTDLVDEVKTQVESGTLQVDANAIAQQMARELF